MLFKDMVREMTDDQLEDFIKEWREMEFRAHQMRHGRTAGKAQIALRVAWKEKNRREADHARRMNARRARLAGGE